MVTKGICGDQLGNGSSDASVVQEQKLPMLSLIRKDLAMAEFWIQIQTVLSFNNTVKTYVVI
jgi:hypothetical protein